MGSVSVEVMMIDAGLIRCGLGLGDVGWGGEVVKRNVAWEFFYFLVVL